MTSAAQPDTDRELARGLAGAAIAVTAWSSGTILAKDIDMDPLAIGVYRFAVFGFGLYLVLRLRSSVPFVPLMRRSLWGGLALGLDIALFFSAVKNTSIVNATVIGSLQPVVVGVVAARFFGETIRSRDALWSLVALAGAVVVVRTGADADVTSLRGDLFAVGAMFAWSGYFIASRQSRDHMTSQEFTCGSSIWTMLICLPIGVVAGQDLSWPSPTNWAWLLLMILVAGVIGHSLMNWALVRIPLWVGSTFTLFIPVASALLAWLVLDEAVSLPQALAMAAVIASLAMIVRGQTRPTPSSPASAGSAAEAPD